LFDGTKQLTQKISNQGAISIDNMQAGIYFIKKETEKKKTIVKQFTKE
jgi:hypothetical protein